MKTKEEVYKSLIEIHKEHGQGLSGIVRVLDDSIGKHLDELIEEGHVVCCDTGGSLGHPESNKFYMPTKGYNVWTDEADDDDNGKYLPFVRLYLGKLADESQKERDDLDENDSNLRRFLNPTASELLEDHGQEYEAWLEKNKEELGILINLEETL